MKRDIETYCATCDICQKTKKSNFSKFGLLYPHDIPSEPYESVSLDLIVDLPLCDNFNAVLVVVDRFTKHAQFIKTTSGLDQEGFAELFVSHVALRFGLPSSIIADRDPRWVNHFWKSVCRRLDVKLALSTARHPQHDGQTEIVNQQLETMLRAYVANDKSSWSHWLPMLEYAYNSLPSGSTKFSPFYLLYGYLPRGPWDYLTSRPQGVTRLVDEHEGAQRFINQFRMLRQAARDAIAKAQEKQARAYNKGRKELVFQPGDLVMINPHSLQLKESKGPARKLTQLRLGPYPVQERVGPNSYRIELTDNYPMHNVINVSHLTRYRRSPEEFGERSILPETRSEPPTEEYSVDKIIAHRWNRSKKQFEFLTRWESFGPEHDAWLTRRDLRNAPARLRAYLDDPNQCLKLRR